jgi:hypothetical protein
MHAAALQGNQRSASIRLIFLAVSAALIVLVVVWMRSDPDSDYQDPSSADTEPRRESSQ